MTNVTFTVPEELRRKMRKHPEVKWSEILRRAINDYLERLEGGIRPARELRELIERDGMDLSGISLERAERHYELMRGLAWKRSSTTRAR